MLHTSIEELNQMGISIVKTKEAPVYRGTFFPKVHMIVTNEFHYLLEEGEQFHLPSDFLLTMLSLSKEEMPSISTDRLRFIILEYTQHTIQKVS